MSTATAPIPATQSLHMVLGQLFTNEIIDERILSAFASVPRECFVPSALAGSAYVDDDLPLGNGRFLIAPLPLARMIKLTEIKPESKVLVVGCATGYSLAVLSQLAAEVVGCESDEALAATAKKNLAALNISNVRVEVVPNLAEGAAKGGPYDAIIIEGAAEVVGETIKRQLSGHGTLVAAERIVSTRGLVQGLDKLVTYVPAGKSYSRKTWQDTCLPLLPGLERKKGFVF